MGGDDVVVAVVVEDGVTGPVRAGGDDDVRWWQPVAPDRR